MVQAMKTEEGDENEKGGKGYKSITPLFNNTLTCHKDRNVLRQ